MALLRLSEAAALSGKAPTTLHRAMKSGRLSFTLSPTGERQIDPAELDRVYGIRRANGASALAKTHSEPDARISTHSDDSHENLQTQLRDRLREVAQLREQLDETGATVVDLRRRLDESERDRRLADEERRAAQRTIAALIDSRSASVVDSPSPARRRRWWRLGR